MNQESLANIGYKELNVPERWPDVRGRFMWSSHLVNNKRKFTGKNQKHAQNYNVVSGRLREFDDYDKFPL